MCWVRWGVPSSRDVRSPVNPQSHPDATLIDTISGTPTLRVRQLRPDATVPQYQTAGAAGMDLHACIAEPVTIAPGRIAAIPTGLSMEIPQGFEGQVRPRSGLATKHGVTVPNAPGTIDSDYRGEVIVALINLGQDTFTVTPGMRIAQMVIAAYTRVRIETVDTLTQTARGSGGFGSTGV